MQASISIQTVVRRALRRELEREGIDGPRVSGDRGRHAAAEAACFGVIGGRTTLPLDGLEHALRTGLRAAQEHVPGRDTSDRPPPSARLQAVRDAAIGDPSGKSSPKVGDLIDGKYRLEALQAEGGFGRVFRARDLDLDCDVAIKLLKPKGSGEAFDPAQVDAFKREAQRLTKLAHPGIVDWKTLNQTSDGTLYLVMEFLDGEELESCLRREGPLPARRVAKLLLQVLDALAHAHGLADGQSLLHLDLKPSNVFLLEGARGAETVKVLDFGISRFAGRSAELDDGAQSAVPDHPARTTTFDAKSGLACTPHYCSPELAQRILRRFPNADPATAHRSLDGRADLYALGVMGYQMLTGHLPFEGEGDILALLRRHVSETPAPLRPQVPGMPTRLARFVERCLEKDPENRWSSADEAIGELRKVVEPRRVWGPVFAGAALACALVALAVFPKNDAPAPPFRAMLRDSSLQLQGSHLFFGPELPKLVLDSVGLHSDDGVQSVRVVDATRGELNPMDWIAAKLSGPGEIRLSVEPGAPQLHRTAILEVTTNAGSRQSAPFQITHVPADAWSLGKLDVPDRGGRAVRAEGLELQLEVLAPKDWLQRAAAVRLGNRVFHARLDDSAGRDDDVSRYYVALGPVAAQASETELHLAVEVTDRALGTHARTITLPIVDQDLGIETLALAGLPESNGTWLASPSDLLLLDVQGSRPAQLRWELADSKGNVLANGESNEPLDRHSIDLGQATWARGDQLLTLLVELDERELVMYAPNVSGATASAELSLRLDATGARFDAELSRAVRNFVEGEAAPTYYMGKGEASMVVLRDHDTPMIVEARLSRDGEAPLLLGTLDFQSYRAERQSLELPDLPDGNYLIALDGRRLDSNAMPLDRVDASEEIYLVRDTSGPELQLEELSSETSFRSGKELAAKSWTVLDAEGDDPNSAPMVRYRWTLEGVKSGVSTSGEEAWQPGDQISMAQLGSKLPGGWKDGPYELQVRGVDLLGNDGPSTAFQFSISILGPRLRAHVPASGAPWANIDGLFLVELVAEDANGTATITGLLRDAKDELAAQPFELSPPESGLDDDPWTAELELDFRWSERRVVVSFSGVDNMGTPSMDTLDIPCRLAFIPNPSPERISAVYLGRDDAPMRLVPGNRNGDYLFGGRSDAIEDEAFRRAGLGGYGAGILSNSLAIRVPQNSIADYYLDEHEVTVAQFRRFLADKGSADNLDDERRGALLDATAGAQGDLPMTGVDFAEADAYARWAGKELPTYLHWEFAVRGEDARPAAHSGQDVDPSAINAGTGEPWPVGHGSDVSVGTAIENLGSNVAEWTTTGADEPLGERPLDSLLGRVESPGSTRHFVVGGSFARKIYHFGAVRRLRRTQSAPSIGFRCMLRGKTVHQTSIQEDGPLRIFAVR